MFEKLKLTEWILEDFGSELGVIKANYNFLKENKVANIFTKNKDTYEVVQVGYMNFEELDHFIKVSMNKFYENLDFGTEEEKARKKSDYKHLFEIWQNIVKAKETNSQNLSDLYNDLVYALHMLGYKK